MSQLDISPKDRILIVAPHADDESIGCGGFMALYAQQCDVLLLSDGRNGKCGTYSNLSTEDYIGLRERELLDTIAQIGIKRLYSLNLPDCQVYKYFNRISKFDFSKYSYIFIPNRKEAHPDHRCVFGIMKKLQRKHKLGNAILVEYEVWTPLIRPNIIYDISNVIEIKKRMISNYKSQIETLDYVNKSVALNEYRGINGNVAYAEAYFKNTFCSELKYLFSQLPISLQMSIKNFFKYARK